VIESKYGFASGLEFLVLTVMFGISFYILSKLLKESDILNSILKNQRRELVLFWITVSFGYGVRTVIQLLYGYYYLFIK
jgi:hypothetical protein